MRISYWSSDVCSSDLHGIAVVAHRFKKFTPEGAFQFLQDFGVRNTFLPPTALKMMRSVDKPETRWNYRLRSVASGGESLGAELLDWGKIGRASGRERVCQYV